MAPLGAGPEFGKLRNRKLLEAASEMPSGPPNFMFFKGKGKGTSLRATSVLHITVSERVASQLTLKSCHALGWILNILE